MKMKRDEGTGPRKLASTKLPQVSSGGLEYISLELKDGERRIEVKLVE
jgi:hypothetical protein